MSAEALPEQLPTSPIDTAHPPFGRRTPGVPRLRWARRHAVIAGSALLVLAAAMTVSVRASPSAPWFQPFDDGWRRLMLEHRSTVADQIARTLSVVGSTPVTLPTRAIIVVVLLARKRWTQLATFATAIAVSEISIGLLKNFADRPRPPMPLVATTGSSFPSGHAIAAAVTALGAVVAFLPRGVRRWHWISGASFLAASMSWSRTYLSAHWATDTIAGTAIGVACALLAEALFEGGRRTARVAIAESVAESSSAGPVADSGADSSGSDAARAPDRP